jgi:hypothetical protein
MVTVEVIKQPPKVVHGIADVGKSIVVPHRALVPLQVLFRFRAPAMKFRLPGNFDLPFRALATKFRSCCVKEAAELEAWPAVVKR